MNKIFCVSQEIGDQTTLAKSFYLLAALASQEQQHGQALTLLEQAQEIGGDEDFWYNLIQSLLNTTAQLEGDIYTQVRFFNFCISNSVMMIGQAKLTNYTSCFNFKPSQHFCLPRKYVILSIM